MKWNEAVEVSLGGFAYALAYNDTVIYVTDRDGLTWMRTVENPTTTSRMTKSAGSRARANWQPFDRDSKEKLTEEYGPELALYVYGALALAEREYKKKQPYHVQLAETLKPCDFHKGQRGLQTLLKEWEERVGFIKSNMELLNGKVDFSNQNLVDSLDEIITHATKMRELL